MPAITTTLASSKTTTGPGEWAKIRHEEAERTLQVSISGTATVSIEVSNDGVNAVTLASGISSSGAYQDDGAWLFIRVNVTSISGGSVTVVMGEME